MMRPLPRPLVVAVLVVCSPLHVQPARWWRSPNAVAQLHLTRSECDEIDHLYQRALPAEQEASVEAARMLNAISRQLDDSFDEQTLLALTERLVAAQAHERAVQHDLSRHARAVCLRRHAPEWLITRVTQ